MAQTEYSQSARAKYMNRELTHDQYYGLIVEALGEAALRRLIPASRERIVECLKTDPHLNNIPLAEWDTRFHAFMTIPRPIGGLSHITGSTGWSLSDCVCTLKCAAKRWAQSED